MKPLTLLQLNTSYSGNRPNIHKLKAPVHHINETLKETLKTHSTLIKIKKYC